MNSDERTNALFTALGTAVRERRLSLGFTLKEVEASTGLSHSFLSKMERGLARPSMRTLTAVADMLGTTAHTLMTADAEPHVPTEVSDVRVGHSIEVAHSGGVARALMRGQTPFLPVEFLAGPAEFEEYYVHPGAEMMYVAAGICQMEVDGHGVFELGPGESLFYGAHMKHRWRQVSGGPIRMLLIQDNVEQHGVSRNGHEAS